MRVKATLQINIWYDDCANIDEPTKALEEIVQNISDGGMTFYNSPMIVDTWNCEILTKEVKK